MLTSTLPMPDVASKDVPEMTFDQPAALYETPLAGAAGES